MALTMKKTYGDLKESYYGIPTEEIKKENFDWSRFTLEQIAKLPETLRKGPRRVYL